MSAPSKADRVAEAASRHAERTRIRDEARERGRAIIASASDTFLREQTADDLEIAAEDARYAAACRRAALEALDDPAAVVEGHMTVEASKQFLTTLDQADAEYERVTGQKPESFFPVYPFIRRHPLYNGVWVRPGVLEHSAGNALGHAVAQLERDRKAGALLVTLHTDLIQVVTAVGRMAAGVPPPVPADAHDRLDAIFYLSPQAREAKLRELDRALEERNRAVYEQNRQRTIRVREGRESAEDLEFLHENPGFIEGIKHLSESLFGRWTRDAGKPDARRVSE